MSDYLERMENEAAELREKIVALHNFINHDPIFMTVTEIQARLLVAQKSAMIAYATILELRIWGD